MIPRCFKTLKRINKGLIKQGDFINDSSAGHGGLRPCESGFEVGVRIKDTRYKEIWRPFEKVKTKPKGKQLPTHSKS